MGGFPTFSAGAKSSCRGGKSSHSLAQSYDHDAATCTNSSYAQGANCLATRTCYGFVAAVCRSDRFARRVQRRVVEDCSDGLVASVRSLNSTRPEWARLRCSRIKQKELSSRENQKCERSSRLPRCMQHKRSVLRFTVNESHRVLELVLTCVQEIDPLSDPPNPRPLPVAARGRVVQPMPCAYGV